MKQAAPKKVLFVHLNWIIASYTCDLVNALAIAGYQIDFVTTKRSQWRFVSEHDMKARVIKICDGFNRFYNLLWKAWRVFSIVTAWIFPVDPFVIRRFSRAIDLNSYDLVICTEKESLLAVHSRAGGFKKPTYFWSLELYNEGYPRYFKYRRLNERARQIYKELSGFFIQDALRWSVINREVESKLIPYFLPVTTSGVAVRVEQSSPALSLRNRRKCHTDCRSWHYERKPWFESFERNGAKSRTVRVFPDSRPNRRISSRRFTK